MKITHPNELIWIEGDLPDVHTVPKDCYALVWLVHDIPKKDFDSFKRYYPGSNPEELNGKLSQIIMTYPWGNELNPLRWSGMWYQVRVKYYVWINHPEVR